MSYRLLKDIPIDVGDLPPPLKLKHDAFKAGSEVSDRTVDAIFNLWTEVNNRIYKADLPESIEDAVKRGYITKLN